MNKLTINKMIGVRTASHSSNLPRIMVRGICTTQVRAASASQKGLNTREGFITNRFLEDFAKELPQVTKYDDILK